MLEKGKGQPLGLSEQALPGMWERKSSALWGSEKGLLSSEKIHGSIEVLLLLILDSVSVFAVLRFLFLCFTRTGSDSESLVSLD